MPTHVYKPLRNPPNWLDRLMVHPMDTTVAAVSLVFAILLALSAVIPGFTPSVSLEEMPVYISISLAAAFATGGLLILVGLNWLGEEVSRGWALERFGWLLAAGGFLGYCISVSWIHPGSVFSWGIPLALATGSLLRYWSIILIERSTRRTINEVRRRMK